MTAPGTIVGIRSYREALERFSWGALWQLFDGDRRRLNLAHECVDRHAGRGTALRIQFADGRREEHDFATLSAWSSRFAHFLEREGIVREDRVAIMLEPSLAFYGAPRWLSGYGTYDARIARPTPNAWPASGAWPRLDMNCAAPRLITYATASMSFGPGLVR